MRRNRIICSAAAAIIILLTSCNGSPGAIIPDYSEYKGISPENIQINAEYSLNSGSLPAFKQLAEEFNNTNKWNIKVTFISSDRTASADLIITSPAEASALLKDNKTIELSPLFQQPQWGLPNGRGLFYTAARTQTQYWDFSRRISSVPLLMNAGILVVNNDLLSTAGYKKIPALWFFFNQMIKKTSRVLALPVIGTDLITDNIVSVINARGGSILQPVGSAYSLNNPVVNGTIKYINRLLDKGYMVPNNTKYLNQTQFAFGRLPMVFTGTDGLKQYHELISLVEPDLDWGTALMPTKRPGKAVTVDCSHTGAIMRGSAEKMLASWLFLKWMTGVEQQEKLVSSTYSIPANRNVLSKIIDSPPLELLPQWLNAAALIESSHMMPVPAVADYTQVSERIAAMMNKCFDENSWVWLETFKLDYNIKKDRR